jgi:hypothetical protein
MRRVVIAAILAAALAVVVGVAREHRLRSDYGSRLSSLEGRTALLFNRVERIERTSRSTSKDWNARYDDDAAGRSPPPPGTHRYKLKNKMIDLAPDGTIAVAPLDPDRLAQVCRTCLADPSKSECQGAVLQYLNQKPGGPGTLADCDAALNRWSEGQ